MDNNHEVVLPVEKQEQEDQQHQQAIVHGHHIYERPEHSRLDAEGDWAVVYSAFC
jgi:hypothetical protein